MKKSTIAHVSAFLVACSALPASALAQEAEEQQAVEQILGAIRWGGVFTSIIVVFGVWVGLRFLDNFVDRLSLQFPARRMLFQRVGTILQFIAYFVTIALVIALSVRLDENLLPVLGGTFALAVGFGVRDLVASIIAGITIMLDQPFQVGDRVAFQGQYGDITAIGLRSVRLQTIDDNTVTIPNNNFLTEVTACGNYGALDMQVVMDFYIGLDQPVDMARDVVNEAALTSRYVHLPKPVVVLVSQVIQQNYVAVRLRLKAYVLDTLYEMDFETDVNLRVLRAFEKRGIQPPAILVRSHDGEESTARPVSVGVA